MEDNLLDEGLYDFLNKKLPKYATDLKEGVELL